MLSAERIFLFFLVATDQLPKGLEKGGKGQGKRKGAELLDSLALTHSLNGIPQYLRCAGYQVGIHRGLITSEELRA